MHELWIASRKEVPGEQNFSGTAGDISQQEKLQDRTRTAGRQASLMLGKGGARLSVVGRNKTHSELLVEFPP